MANPRVTEVPEDDSKSFRSTLESQPIRRAAEGWSEHHGAAPGQSEYGNSSAFGAGSIQSGPSFGPSFTNTRHYYEPHDSAAHSQANRPFSAAEAAELEELRHMYRNSALQSSAPSQTAGSGYDTASLAPSASLSVYRGIDTKADRKDGGLKFLDPIPKNNPFNLPLKGWKTKKYNPQAEAPGWHKDHKMRCQTEPDWEFLSKVHVMRGQRCKCCKYPMHLPVSQTMCEKNYEEHIANDESGRRILTDQPYNEGKDITTGDWDYFVDTLDPLILGHKTLTEECQATLEEEPEDEPIVPSGATPEQAKDIEAKIQTIRNNNEDLMRKQKRILDQLRKPV